MNGQDFLLAFLTIWNAIVFHAILIRWHFQKSNITQLANSSGMLKKIARLLSAIFLGWLFLGGLAYLTISDVVPLAVQEAARAFNFILAYIGIAAFIGYLLYRRLPASLMQKQHSEEFKNKNGRKGIQREISPTIIITACAALVLTSAVYMGLSGIALTIPGYQDIAVPISFAMILLFVGAIWRFGDEIRAGTLSRKAIARFAEDSVTALLRGERHNKVFVEFRREIEDQWEKWGFNLPLDHDKAIVEAWNFYDIDRGFRITYPTHGPIADIRDTFLPFDSAVFSGSPELIFIAGAPGSRKNPMTRAVIRAMLRRNLERIGIGTTDPGIEAKAIGVQDTNPSQGAIAHIEIIEGEGYIERDISALELFGMIKRRLGRLRRRPIEGYYLITVESLQRYDKNSGEKTEWDIPSIRRLCSLLIHDEELRALKVTVVLLLDRDVATDLRKFVETDVSASRNQLLEVRRLIEQLTEGLWEANSSIEAKLESLQEELDSVQHALSKDKVNLSHIGASTDPPVRKGIVRRDEFVRNRNDAFNAIRIRKEPKANASYWKARFLFCDAKSSEFENGIKPAGQVLTQISLNSTPSERARIRTAAAEKFVETFDQALTTFQNVHKGDTPQQTSDEALHVIAWKGYAALFEGLYEAIGTPGDIEIKGNTPSGAPIKIILQRHEFKTKNGEHEITVKVDEASNGDDVQKIIASTDTTTHYHLAFVDREHVASIGYDRIQSFGNLMGISGSASTLLASALPIFASVEYYTPSIDLAMLPVRFGMNGIVCTANAFELLRESGIVEWTADAQAEYVRLDALLRFHERNPGRIKLYAQEFESALTLIGRRAYRSPHCEWDGTSEDFSELILGLEKLKDWGEISDVLSRDSSDTASSGRTIVIGPGDNIVTRNELAELGVRWLPIVGAGLLWLECMVVLKNVNDSNASFRAAKHRVVEDLIQYLKDQGLDWCANIAGDQQYGGLPVLGWRPPSPSSCSKARSQSLHKALERLGYSDRMERFQRADSEHVVNSFFFGAGLNTIGATLRGNMIPFDANSFYDLIHAGILVDVPLVSGQPNPSLVLLHSRLVAERPVASNNHFKRRAEDAARACMFFHDESNSKMPEDAKALLALLIASGIEMEEVFKGDDDLLGKAIGFAGEGYRAIFNKQ